MRFLALPNSMRLMGTNRGQDGFTLTEMLVTTLVLVMAATLLATGIPVAMDTYQKTVNAANAQVALSTTVSAVRGELSLASEVRVSSDKSKVYYLSRSEGCWISLERSDTHKGLDKTYYKGVLSPGQDVSALVADETIPLISDSTITDPLRVLAGDDDGKNSFNVDSENADVVVVNNLRVLDGSNNALAKIDGEYRVLARFKS